MSLVSSLVRGERPGSRAPALAAYADVGRAGLGNILFPWARCALWCSRHSATMLSPRWFRLRIGPFLRHERDKRRYDKLFRRPSWRQRLLRSTCLLSMPRRAEPALLDAAPAAGGLYCFAGQGRGFAPLLGHSAFVGKELLAIVRPELLPRRGHAPFLAVHVRRGDFSTPTSAELTQGRHNYRIPIDWYVRVLRALRAGLNRGVRALVFSDGADHELAPLLAEDDTWICRNEHAVVDLLKMSQATALVASGSTFSMWASFLGQVPAVWYPGQRREILLSNSSGILEPEWSTGPFEGAFLHALADRLRLD